MAGRNNFILANCGGRLNKGWLTAISESTAKTASTSSANKSILMFNLEIMDYMNSEVAFMVNRFDANEA